MDDLVALIAGLDGLSVFIGLTLGFLFALAVLLITRSRLYKAFQKALEEQRTSFSSLSSEALKSNQESFLNLANDKFSNQTERHSSELDSKKELIDTQLQQMSDTLKTVPTELSKSTEDLKDANQDYLNQLTEKAKTQTKEHNKELESKKELIDLRLTDMGVKLGKVERLVQELQTDRKAQYGALGQQLQHLTHTTTSLQKALADNQARGQWGERIAEDILRLLGFVEGVNYDRQTSTEDGRRPDFTFHLPNQLTLNMDAKFPLDNYLLYHEAESDQDRRVYSDKFLRDVNSRVLEIQKRDYISAETLDCVLIFIPNEQVYRFIHEQNSAIIDSALRQKVILCSPLTLYIVLAVIRQASQNFNIEQKSREIVAIVNEIRQEWDKYTGEMQTLSNHFQRVYNNLQRLTVTRTRALDRRFDKIETMLDSNELSSGDAYDVAQLPEEAT